MRSVLACIMVVSALPAGGVQASAADLQVTSVAEPSPKVSVQSAEGQAIIKRVRVITGRLQFLNQPPVYPPGLVHYPTLDPNRTNGWLAPPRVRPEAITTATGLRQKLMVERALLLSRLDVDRLEQIRMGLH